MELFDEEAEQIVIGSLLSSPHLFSEITEVVRPEDFFSEGNRIIFETLSELVDENQVPDTLLLLDALKAKNSLEKAGNYAKITSIASMGSAVSAPIYATRVRDFALRRALIENMREIQRGTIDIAQPLEEILSETEKKIYSITNRYSQTNVQHIRETKAEFAEFLKKVVENRGSIPGTATGFQRFDSVTGGLKGGQMIVLAARPAAGKTTLAMNIAQNIALKLKKPVLIYSLEMSRLELFLRFVASWGYYDSRKLSRGDIGAADIERLKRTATEIISSDIYIDDSADLNTWQFKQRSRRLNNQLRTEGKELGLIVVDYLQLMTDSQRRDQRHLEVASVSRALKLIAKDLNVPVIAVSQMNRSIEQRGKDPKPQLSDLRESGAIEQDADMVVFIHREELFNKDLPDTEKNKAEIIIAKHRAGPTDAFKVNFLKDKNLFRDIDEHAPDSI